MAFSFSKYLHEIKYKKTWQRKKVNKIKRTLCASLSNLYHTKQILMQSFYILHLFSSILTPPIYFASFQHTVCQGVLFIKCALKDFGRSSKRNLFWSLFLLKLQALRFATLLKRDYSTDVFLLIRQTF